LTEAREDVLQEVKWVWRDGSLAQAVSHWLGAALEETGVGAKTRSGYGAMQVRES
jgi:CRISPR/Cas system CMR subunit Cmr6 (Cas7 group RAMP superfamily)